VEAIRKVFLSSTGADLKDYREAAFLALQKLDGWKCVRMEDFEARARDVDTFCRAEVARCDLFLGIIGHRFGAAPKGSRESYAQREYRAALEARKPVLLFLAADDFPIPANLLEPMAKIKAQAKFRESLRNGGKHIVALGFTSPADLAQKIVTSVYNSGGRKKPDAQGYLKFLWEDTAYIDIRGLRISNEDVHRFRIDDLYTPLTTVLAQEEPKRKKEKKTRGKEEEARLAARQPVPLQRALENRRVVLVGDPGAGKSTFLRRIAFAACETLLGRNPLAAAELLPAGPCPFPLLIRAASLSNHILRNRRAVNCPPDADSPEWVIHYLEAEAQGKNRTLDAAFFREQLDGGCLLLLDGLDEAADRTERKAMARLLELTARAYEKTQVVATSRPPAYGGETVIPGFATIQIGPLEDEAVAVFVGKWCRALVRDEEKAGEHQAELLSAIRSKPEIQDMAVNPVMLTAIAALHWNRTRLPDQRTELYDSILTWLAQARDEKRDDKRKEAPIAAQQCLALMQHLAYTMHSDAKGKQVEITRHAAARALAPRFREVPEEEQAAAADSFLKEEETDSGIVIARGNTLRYWHLTFQEYLAAKALASKDADCRRLLFEEQKLYLPEWRETVLLLAGVLCKQDPERVDALLKEMFDRLGAQATLGKRARCVGLVGRILRDLKSWNYRIADARYRENLERVLAIFDAQAARQIDFATRLEVADALGQAGDPRLDPGQTNLSQGGAFCAAWTDPSVPSSNWVKVEGGLFWMGAQKEDPAAPNYDAEAFDDESPVHRVAVAAFYLGRYPVTVFEYEHFVAAGGYRKEQLWRAGGYGQFTEPGNWRRQLGYPNRPVVEVSWYEAAAYCQWAGVRLPTEAEWECAARCGREGVRYPWGNEDPDKHRANFAGGSGHPTPVGLYPAGATPDDIHDLAGNVWEWVQNWWGEYSGKEAENPKGPEKGDGKVVRGGGWYLNPNWLRVSDRDRYPPEFRLDGLGFRCVRELLPL
jgi:formylglycine-generating enzyme required for sulfatase activity